MDRMMRMDGTMSIIPTCGYCGMCHPDQTCPRIKEIEYHPNGTIKRIVFHDQKPPTNAVEVKYR